jgi:hypothetical protein
MSGAPELMPSMINKNPLKALNWGEFMLGIITTTKAEQLEIVMRAKKKFLAGKTGSHANA